MPTPSTLPRARRVAAALALTTTLGALAPPRAHAQGAPAPVAAARATPATAVDRDAAPPILTRDDARLAAAFAVVGAAATRLDRPVALHFARPDVQHDRAQQRTATLFRRAAIPGVWVALPALYAVGRATDDRGVADVGLHGSEAVLVGQVVTDVIKVVAGRARPFVDPSRPGDFAVGRRFLKGSDYQSFPSGHTSTAFAAAAALTAEATRRHPGQRWPIGLVAYGSAAMAGWSRMYDRRHWATDVVTGALIGTLAGTATVRAHHARPDNRWDRWWLGGGAGSTASGGTGLQSAIFPP